MRPPREAEARTVLSDGSAQYDVTRFLRLHPGGCNTLAAYKGASAATVAAKMRHEHSRAANYLAGEYVPGADPARDLEVGALGPRYYEWVCSPVDRPLRLFRSDLLEALSVTPWRLVPAVWLPVVAAVLARGLADNDLLSSPVRLQTLWFVPCLLLGLLLWSLLEYSIHRWVFHMRPPDDSPALITLHFLLHGLHHKVPFDSGRLLFPPALAVAVALLLYSVLSLLFPAWMLHYVTAGTISGYVTYDLMHYYLHYGSPGADTYLYNMKRYHNQHHFTQHESGFGISSSFWDDIFRTKIILKKLYITLKW
ncbi:fatty acid 2-hydroxylase isoform X2 [Bacillus rossius redtenbacheri]|uniref:fatty acid 2-hydroxylase isoform X2 n=1 Tax=Bacillus rossius redtenbacheri TaxID=93214 RepID=UPI002FDE9BD2